ncbi:MAG: NADP-dependent isocitrate dehydrogenase [Myxococcota bacterium]
MSQPTIIYTKTDEAPALATYSFLPIIQAFTAPADIDVQVRDISLAARVLAVFPDVLAPEQRVPDALSELGELTQSPDANIIKLPNVSASMPQLLACISELQAAGYPVPDYPKEPADDAARDVKARYDRVKGSAVNPVLREGNSDRRAPKAVKAYARQHPHRMGKWSADSKTHVASMSGHDFFANETSITVPAATTARIEHVAPDGTVRVLKDNLPLQKGEILDATFMSKRALISFFEAQVADAKATGVLFSLHLKATMMKVSDPIIFGHAVRVYFKDLFTKHGATFERLEVDVNNGFGDLVGRLSALPEAERAVIEADIERALAEGPALAMVDSHRGITNLHVPSDVIIDASMPAMIRTSGQMWNRDDATQDTKACIPDRSYAGAYQTVIDDCKARGAFDPRTMGSVANVGLMAQRAEEYGSHDKTFEVPATGRMRIVDADGKTLLEHDVEAGDIWRACQVKDAPVRDWVKLGVTRARASNAPAVFWLDEKRAHDAQLIAKVNAYLKDHDLDGVEVHIKNVADATAFTLSRVREGQDTISVTGNVLRDYLTDLFPILEVGTSAKMLSVVPLMKGGGLYETGAGGSAPKLVQQFEKEGHLRWDSLGEFLALAVSIEHLSERFDHRPARVMAAALDAGTEQYLMNNRSPSRKVNEIDNRGSHFYLALYWAQALAAQTDDEKLSAKFKPVAAALAEHEKTIVSQLEAAQGRPVDLGGYFWPDEARAVAEMRPSATFNRIIDGF